MRQHIGRAILGTLAAIATILGSLLQFGVIDSPFEEPPDEESNGSEGSGSSSGGSDQPGGGSAPTFCDGEQLSLSQGRGPSGTEVTVSGSGFAPDEDVDLRFHTETLTPSRTDGTGAFEVVVTIPGSFDAFAPGQFDIHASTNPACRDSVPFQLTS